MIPLGRYKNQHGYIYMEFVISMLFLGMFFIYSIEYIHPVKIYIELNQLVRKYTLLMEKDGYLSPSNLSNLQNEITALGINISDVTISATTTKVDFGQEVFLDVNYNYRKIEKQIDGLNVKKVEKIFPMHIRKSTTSKNGS